MKIINLTPHPLVIRRPDGTNETIESSGIARCEQTEKIIGDVDGVPVVCTSFGSVVGLPDADPPCDGYSHQCPHCGRYEWGHGFGGCEACGAQPRVFVVSSISAQAVPHRKDVFVPARPLRDEQGRIIACTALGRIA